MFASNRPRGRRILTDLEATMLMADFAGNDRPVPSHRVRSWPKRPFVLTALAERPLARAG